ncbi:MAG: HD domain-containing protein [Aigarchaeota archaeon]|nr:HD domain-containing protein [Aigarchaeota archaeon]MCX8193164.1 HD domain-containing protein [Nitrososphaeria archaeon]MDW7986305.1 HD domain-containing protein [Nitrososphaerota archaeon]
MEKQSVDIFKIIHRFHMVISKVKEIKRTGWIQRGIEDAESVADHSFAVLSLSMILAEIRGLNVVEVVRMAILHDLAEAVIGDLTPSQKREKIREYERVEREFIESLVKLMPKDIGEKYLEAWRRYLEGESREARLVGLVDKLEMGLQAVIYLKKTGNEKLLEIYRSALEFVENDSEILNILKEALNQ